MVSHRRTQFAFTLPEILVGMAIIAMLAAIMFPVLTHRLRAAEVSALTSNLQGINQAVQAYKQNVGRYPYTLLQLSVPPSGVNVPEAQDLCGVNLPTNYPGFWRGPYLTQIIEGGEIPVGHARILAQLQRVNPAADGNYVARITVDNVDSVTFIEVEKAFDGFTDPNGGTVQWAKAGPGPIGPMTFDIPTRGC